MIENLTINKTKQGNFQYCLQDLPVVINVTIDKNSCRIFIKSKEVTAQEINPNATSKHVFYLTSVKKQEYEILCESLIHTIRLLTINMTLEEALLAIYKKYNPTPVKKEANIKEEVLRLKDEINVINDKLNKLYVLMEE